MPGELFDKLAELASDQYGYVTQSDARELDIERSALVKMAHRGAIEHVSYGLYRVKLFPRTQFDPYMEAVLWPAGVRGVISHASALVLYELSNVNPSKIHMCVPSSHRPRRAIPREYEVHRENLDPDEVSKYEGIPIVTAEKAIVQAHSAALGPELVGQAIDAAYSSGMLSKAAAARLRRSVGVKAGVELGRS